MKVAKVTVLIESEVLKQLDRLARSCEMLDPVEEQAFAEIGASTDLEEWPEY